ncbi:MAG: sigma 54-interacting transcriptional regulator [Myxococcota bacterium]|nr:sigma 54-dependent Fis family transcriptional regulator [Myxococcota bacterium]
MPTDLLRQRQQPSAPLKLVVISAGTDNRRELALEKGTYRIGKSSGTDLCLADTSVSRVHLLARVLADGKIELIDQGSTNGSFYDGLRFERLEARAGTVVRIGKTDLKVVAADSSTLESPVSTTEHFGGLYGESLPMRQVFALMERVAPTDSTILVRGETGTGKEVCAAALHAASGRRAQPFVVCDLAAATPSLIESELFGHVKGAFTDAHGDRAGAFEAAHGGTLFLDEVGELPLEVQARLLRAIETGEVKRVGSSSVRRFDARVIAATHRDLESAVAAGTFRKDLYYRLAVVQITLPPLRDRVQDIPLLVDRILATLGKPASDLAPETRALLTQYPWPGNVRELRNVIERALTLGGDAQLPSAETARADEMTFKDAKDKLLAHFERDYIRAVLQRCKGNIARAARESGLHRAHVHRLINKYDLGSD